jgi:hypothetical protein
MKNMSGGQMIMYVLGTIILVSFWVKVGKELVGVDTIQAAAKGLVNIITGAAT